jgi:hypothetical protein
MLESQIWLIPNTFQMPRNKIKQDFNFTTLKWFKIIKLTTCDRFYNNKKKNPAPFTVFDSFSHLFLSCQYVRKRVKHRERGMIVKSVTPSGKI